MSLRASFSGFELKKLTSLFGCRDAAVWRRLEAFLLEKLADPEGGELGAEELERNRHVILDACRRIVDGGIRKGVPESEGPPLIYAVSWLAHFEQDHLETDSDAWRGPAFLDYHQRVLKAEFPPLGSHELGELRTLMGHLWGRPFFGAALDSDWTTYGWLTQAEVSRLVHLFERAPGLALDPVAPPPSGLLARLSAWAKPAPDQGESFGADLKRWLREARDAKKDLWVFCD